MKLTRSFTPGLPAVAPIARLPALGARTRREAPPPAPSPGVQTPAAARLSSPAPLYVATITLGEDAEISLRAQRAYANALGLNGRAKRRRGVTA